MAQGSGLSLASDNLHFHFCDDCSSFCLYTSLVQHLIQTDIEVISHAKTCLRIFLEIATLSSSPCFAGSKPIDECPVLGIGVEMDNLAFQNLCDIVRDIADKKSQERFARRLGKIETSRRKMLATQMVFLSS